MPLVVRPFHRRSAWTSAVVLISLAAAAGAEAPGLQLGVEGGGGFAGLAVNDFAKAAADRGGSAKTSGWTAGGRALVFLPGGLGASIGVSEDGGASYDNTVFGYNKKKVAFVTTTTSARFTQTSVPVSLHYRLAMEKASAGAEAGVDFVTATVAYAETDNYGGDIRGDLKQTGMGYHIAAEASLNLVAQLWGYLRVGYVAADLKAFEGMLNDNGTQKLERLFMVKNSLGDQEDLEVSTSTSTTSSDHRLAEVGGTGLRLTIGLRVLFP